MSSILFIVISDVSKDYFTSSAVSFEAFNVSIRVTSSSRFTFDSCNNYKILSSSSLIVAFALEIFWISVFLFASKEGTSDWTTIPRH